MPQSPTTSPDAAPDPALEGAIDRLFGAFEQLQVPLAAVIFLAISSVVAEHYSPPQFLYHRERF